MRTAVYPGSFDPPTSGHLDIVARAAKLVDLLFVAVLVNADKKPLFSADERVDMLRVLTRDVENVRVVSFSGLLAEFCRREGISAVIRGLRAVTDFEYEFQMALTNKSLNMELETLFLPASAAHVYLSSGILKEVARFGGHASHMAPALVLDELRRKFGIKEDV